MRLLALIVALLLVGCATPTASPASGRLDLVDLTDEFAEEADRTATLDDAARVAGIKQRFSVLLPGFYDSMRFGRHGAGKYDARLLKALRGLPNERAEIADVSKRFAAMLKPAQRSFEERFGPMTGYPPVYLVHSLGEFDGGTRSLPDGERLLFGADMIAQIHRGHSVQPFFHHELFHLYHSRSFSGCEAIWCALWTEGLATYVASQLNPGATDAELLLVFPEPLRPAVERDRRYAVCSIRSRLNSSDEDDYNALYSSGGPEKRLPGRFAYYVGFLVAAQAAEDHSLQELASLSPSQVRPLIEKGLSALASCPE